MPRGQGKGPPPPPGFAPVENGRGVAGKVALTVEPGKGVTFKLEAQAAKPVVDKPVERQVVEVSMAGGQPPDKTPIGVAAERAFSDPAVSSLGREEGAADGREWWVRGKTPKGTPAWGFGRTISEALQALKGGGR